MGRIRQWARQLKNQILLLYYASRDERTPRLAKWLALAVVLYAISPIDLIPDFIPVLGYLDDVLLLPAGIWLVLRLLPDGVKADSLRRAEAHPVRLTNRSGAIVVVAVWFGLAYLLFRLIH